MSRHVVARTDELADGERKIVEIEGRSIGLFRVGDAWYAVRNTCPHQSGPLCRGYLTGLLESDGPGEFRYSRRGEMLRCPWHGWEFDLRTGQSWVDPTRLRVRHYETTVEPGSALLTGTPPVAPGQRVPGPYTAETYEVSVDHDYVVIEF
ncbi:Rieske (2Fe-2S) protein [Pseudonocardia sp. RS11V-5]|uniref:Rieske (2Fe-2S) protein n=1 Tax=Pseudonocardia terrae TaxID=2905831 RepID=UPI001E626F50|nr:Rieske (2Fe-2S) protein [Pseudonocardia terrae]MCE3551400.1 Rieske (2Fe-2S) protein [Pseudonocardia terrae]